MSLNDAGYDAAYASGMRTIERLLGRSPTTHVAAQARSADGVTIYFREGCPYCLTLSVRVRRYASRATWVNIWADPEGAAFVRSVNDGDETVPTVVIGGVAHTNPRPGLVADALRHLPVP